jgi:SAM-dependent methyltransferase
MRKTPLPAGFDAEIYYRLNPDVRNAGVDAAEHYQIWGVSEGRRWQADVPHYERDYNVFVTNLLAAHPLEEAMSLAVGGDFETMGRLQVDQLEKRAGLSDGMTVVDLGCGSGRTLSQIAKKLPACQCVGIDVVQDLLNYAQSICPPSYRFIRHTQLSLPLPDASADLVIVFSVFTHLLHDESYVYLQDAVRVLRPGGRIALSFLEFARSSHWDVFTTTVAARKYASVGHINTFIERPVLDVWGKHLKLDVEGYFDELGQTLCVMRKPG